jgi:hypothetical protein
MIPFKSLYRFLWESVFISPRNRYSLFPGTLIHIDRTPHFGNSTERYWETSGEPEAPERATQQHTSITIESGSRLRLRTFVADSFQ